MKVLVTGGAGYIGSHTCVQLMQVGHEVVILDNFCNSHPVAIERIGRIVGKTPEAERADIRDTGALRDVFTRRRFDAVIHFAGLKAVGESVEKPLEYYDSRLPSPFATGYAFSAAIIRRATPPAFATTSMSSIWRAATLRHWKPCNASGTESR